MSTRKYRKYRGIKPELRAKAVELAREMTPILGSVNKGAQFAADQVGVHVNSVKNWLREADAADAARPGTVTDLAARVKRLEHKLAASSALNQKLAAQLNQQPEPGEALG